MDIPGVTGQEVQTLASLSTARTPPKGHREPAPEDEVSKARGSPEPGEVQAGRAAQASAPEPVIARRGGTKLRVDATTDRLVVQILNANREVIKQIPPEELLKAVANVRKMNGLLFDQLA